MSTIANTITPDGGYSPQATQNDSMTNVLAGITGGPAAQALATASQAGPNYGATNLPQFSSDEDKLRTMFANDQTLAAKYGSTNTTPPAGNPAGFATSPLQQTGDTLGGAGGMVTPGGMTGAVSNDISGQSDALSRIMSAFNFDQPRTLDAYKTMIGALSTLTGQENSNLQQDKQLMAQYGYGTGDNIANDLSAISSLPDQKTKADTLKAAYDAATSDVEKKRISAVAKQYNIKLAPDSLSQVELGYVDTSATLLSTINDALSSLGGVQDASLGPLPGTVPQKLVQSNLTSGLITGDLGNLGRKLLILQGMGDKKIMGGRLIRDLVTRFGGAFPGLNYNKTEITKFLNDMKTQTQKTINAEAVSRGYYGGSQEMLDALGYGQADATPASAPASDWEVVQ